MGLLSGLGDTLTSLVKIAGFFTRGRSAAQMERDHVIDEHEKAALGAVASGDVARLNIERDALSELQRRPDPPKAD